eukprot:6212977-Pleurochrysis_carterae.AAC.1
MGYRPVQYRLNVGVRGRVVHVPSRETILARLGHASAFKSASVCSTAAISADHGRMDAKETLQAAACSRACSCQPRLLARDSFEVPRASQLPSRALEARLAVLNFDLSNTI